MSGELREAAGEVLDEVGVCVVDVFNKGAQLQFMVELLPQATFWGEAVNANAGPISPVEVFITRPLRAHRCIRSLHQQSGRLLWVNNSSLNGC
jgi:hypothetical protein